MKTIYLDTTAWNVLASQLPDHEMLSGSFRRQSARLAIGNFNRVELEQTFLNPNSHDQARALLYCLQKAQDDALYIKDPAETIVAEMWALKYGGRVEYSYDSKDRTKHMEELHRCIVGGVDEARCKVLNERRNSNRAEQYKIAQKRVDSPHLRNELRSVKPDELKNWLQSQCQSKHGSSVLTDVLQARFPEVYRNELLLYARNLLISPVGLASRALVRANLYVFWRYAMQDKAGQLVTRSLFDDTFHLVGATYCDSYITCDADQQKYWDLVLPSHCKRIFLHRSSKIQSYLASGAAVEEEV